MTCPRCAKQNSPEARFCQRCGLDMLSVDQPRPDEDGQVMCARHPNRPTNLRCGRCDTPVCDKCVIIGPAGPRCKDCAKTNVGVRPAAVAYEVKRGVRSLGRGMSPFMWIWIVIIALTLGGGLIRGCTTLFSQGEDEWINPPAQSQDVDE